MGLQKNIEEYYTLYGPMVLRRCRTILNCEEEALDAMQDTFVKILLRYGQSPRDELNGGLFYRAATNTCINRIRSKKAYHRCMQNLTQENNSLTQMNWSADTPETIFDRIKTLQGPLESEIMLLRFQSGFSLRELARQMNMSVSGMRKRVERSLKQLSHTETA
ncbi:MAG: sigma-70 family RNA polymerase sigma factor [Deltaproteobacteria bacterium]|nr:sigma-70 family RNA polymerase sigma factor [Deltaproteobacteria bacterium]